MESEERMKIPTEAEILEFLEAMRRDLEAAGIDPNKWVPKEEEEPNEDVWRQPAPPL